MRIWRIIITLLFGAFILSGAAINAHGWITEQIGTGQWLLDMFAYGLLAVGWIKYLSSNE